ncbi:MAG: patatin family protein [Ruminococcaceae bacterium]|nr:patatin family protein [Oscillospiraceae bacterium]
MKTGLVLEGGASRGYFTVGALDALIDIGFKADYLVGTSAGIANGISYVSNQRGRGLRIGLEYLNDKRYMGMRHLLNPKKRSYYNVEFVFGELPNKIIPFDKEAFDKSGCRVVAALTNLNTGKCEYHDVTGDDPEWKTVVASCALPIMFQPVEIDGQLYMDGGITESIPFQKAIDDGCDKIIVILTRERSYIKKPEAALGISGFLYRKYPELRKALENRTEMYNDRHHRLLELEKEGRIILIAPEIDTSGWKRTERRPEKIQEMYDIGYQTLMKYKNEIMA